MSDIRNVTIKGDAATAFMGARKSRKQKGGFNSAPGPAISLGPSNIASAKKISMASNAFHGGALPPVAPPITPSVPSPASSHMASPAVTPTPALLPMMPQKGGKKALILAPSKTAKSKLHLASPASHVRRTKGTRKIRVQLSCMKKRLTRAKTIKSESRQKPIAEVRRILEEAKLVKPRADGKEVPETVLRDIYSDYMLLRNRVL